MLLISFDRYYTMKNPYRSFSKLKLMAAIGSCFLLSLFFATMPLFGVWSNYTLEDGNIGCCVNYKSRTFNVISYNVCMFVFVFAIPFTLIIVTNIKSLLAVYVVLYSKSECIIIFFKFLFFFMYKG